MFLDSTQLRQLALGFTIALCGALCAVWLNIPLPWMLGPLLLTAATRIAGVQSRCAPFFNKAGRWVIGISLGLYFTPQVAASLLENWLFIALGMVYSMLLAVLGCWAYRRYAGMDLRTAWFAAAIGSASEMANLASRFNARVDQVATVHSVRVMLVVVCVPFAFQWFTHTDPASIVQDARLVNWPGLLGLATGALAAALLFERLRMPNGWMLGPMLFAMALTLLDIQLSALPQWVSWVGQLFIGWSLGDKYRPDFFRSAPRILKVVTILTVLMTLASVALGWLLAIVSEQSVAALILGLVPGGIAEMTITAKVLGLGVPLVTAMQVMRMLCVVILTGPLYQKFLHAKAEQELARRHAAMTQHSIEKSA